MSRIGNKTITIPAGVEVTVAAGNEVTVKGPKGTLTRQFNENMQIDVNGNEIKVVRPNDEKHIKQLHGTTRALLHNMVVGVSEGFTRELEVVGIGFRAAVSGNLNHTRVKVFAIKANMSVVKKARRLVRNSGKGESEQCLRKYLKMMKEFVVTFVSVQKSAELRNAHA